MTKQCCICGKTFETNRNKQVTCGSVECKTAQHKEYLRNYMTQYRMNNRNIINERNKAYMRRVRGSERAKSDTLIGLNYAERQKAKTLEMVGRVKV